MMVPKTRNTAMYELSKDALGNKEDQSIYVIWEVVRSFQRPALLWSIGKDSTALLHMVRKAFLGKVPFPVIHIDTGQKFPEMYTFRDRWARQWDLELIVASNNAALQRGVHCCMDEQMSCCHHLKTQALRQVVEEYHFDALLVGIRRDEHGIRAKERYFSPRSNAFTWDYRHQPVELPGMTPSVSSSSSHLRVHPLLHWSELDIWSYTRNQSIPIVDIYLARKGYRYRSLGCRPATQPIPSSADSIDKIIDELRHSKQSERSGRAQDKESSQRMERLRSLGYM